MYLSADAIIKVVGLPPYFRLFGRFSVVRSADWSSCSSRQAPARQRDCPRSLRGRIPQHMYEPFAVNDHAWRGDRQPVAPFTGEDLRAGEKRLRQSHAQGIVMTRCRQRHHGKAPFACLKSDVGSIQVKSQRRVES